MSRLPKKMLRLALAGIVVIVLSPVCSLAAIPDIIAIIRSDTINTYFGQRIVPAGDQNGDGYADFWVWEDNDDIEPICHLFLGGNPPSPTPAKSLINSSPAGSNVGDVNGDHFDDFAFTFWDWNLALPGKLQLYLGGPLLDTVPDARFGIDENPPIGPFVAGHDLNADGIAEMFSPSLDFDNVQMYDLSLTNDTLPELVFHPTNAQHAHYYFATGLYSGLVVGDFNGDDTADLAIDLIEDPQTNLSGRVNLYWGGQAFDSLPDLVIRRPGPDSSEYGYFGTELVSPGDMNGDGFDDLYISSGQSTDSIGYIYFGGPAIDTLPDLAVLPRTEFSAAAGDINGDGYADLISSRFMFSSAFSYVAVYYGGPVMTGQPDMVINVWELPEYAVYFGQRIAGVGDVNGDGVDDFAVGAVDNNNHGVVYLFAGQKTPVPVEENPGLSLPIQVSLHQNYPNPFNSSTSISFELPHRRDMSLAILNFLGQKVRALAAGDYPAGIHTVTWDGLADDGTAVSSGIYYVQLQAGQNKETKKILLLK